MQIVREAVHQNDRGLPTCIVSDVDAVLISLHELLQEIHLLIQPFQDSFPTKIS
jgi:hypothetical protein